MKPGFVDSWFRLFDVTNTLKVLIKIRGKLTAVPKELETYDHIMSNGNFKLSVA